MICQRLADRTLLIEVDVLGEALGAQHRPEGEDDAGNRPEAEQREHPTRVRAVPESEEFGDDLPRLGQGEPTGEELDRQDYKDCEKHFADQNCERFEEAPRLGLGSVATAMDEQTDEDKGRNDHAGGQIPRQQRGFDERQHHSHRSSGCESEHQQQEENPPSGSFSNAQGTGEDDENDRGREVHGVRRDHPGPQEGQSRADSPVGGNEDLEGHEHRDQD